MLFVMESGSDGDMPILCPTRAQRPRAFIPLREHEDFGSDQALVQVVDSGDGPTFEADDDFIRSITACIAGRRRSISATPSCATVPGRLCLRQAACAKAQTPRGGRCGMDCAVLAAPVAIVRATQSLSARRQCGLASHGALTESSRVFRARCTHNFSSHSMRSQWCLFF